MTIKSRRMRWGHVTGLGDTRSTYENIAGKPVGKKNLDAEWGVKLRLVQDRDQWRAFV
jgi:hypothetical protein